ncbi:MAG TPA: SRPBCC family protein [Actinomycetales bacterium]|nr:SRPBCC family protein [Actinomycetales bacterium]
MGTFTVHRIVSAPAQRTWDVLTDWGRHTGTVPLTRVHAVPADDGRSEGEGSGLVARTGIGPLAYSDRMTVTSWRAPDARAAGRCRLRKDGRLVTGEVELTVVPVAPRRSRVTWQERADVIGVHALPGGAVVERVVGHVVFARVLRRLAREAEAA